MIIIGTGGHARVVAEIAKLSHLEIKGFIDLDYSGEDELILGSPVLGGLDQFKNFSQGISFFAAIGDNAQRKQVFAQMISQDFMPISLIHPTAIIGEGVELGAGTLVCAGSIISTNAQIGLNSIINTGVIIDHETTIGSNSHIAPGSRIAGRVKIGAESFVGIGSNVINNINIGSNVIVGAGSVIIRDIPSNSKVVGIPGRILE